MSENEEVPETLSESLLRAGRELLDASKQTLQDLDDMLGEVADEVAGEPAPAPEPGAP